jgi:Ca2+-binding RTX toxin-like protein
VLLSGGATIDAFGHDGANKLTGNTADNILLGRGGNDTLDGGAGNDTLKGGDGNDIYFLDSTDDQVFEDVGKGKDTVFALADYILAAGQEIEILTLQGSADLDGKGNEFANTINGNAGINVLDGEGGNDTLNGGDGGDFLRGGTGNDVMTGGKGGDLYIVDSAKDKVTEAANQGTDIVVSSLAAYTLGANVETLFLDVGAGNGTGNTLSNVIIGYLNANKLDGGGGNDELKGLDGSDTLIGGAGNDTLDGGAGADSMNGGAGNDIYIVDDTGDIVSEVGGSGIDQVQSSVDFSLATGVDNLTLSGGANIFGKGNDLSNSLEGNDGNNELTGFKGNDKLNGGLGNDTMTGGLGNDTYFVNAAGDLIVETAGQGKDTVISSVNFTITQDIEVLILQSSNSVTGMGNQLANTITMAGIGQSALGGFAGNDTLTGGVNTDFLFGDINNDVLSGGEGNDVLSGGADTDKLTGGNGNDTLSGGAGNDTMIGGLDSDYYVVDSLGDKVTELVNQGFGDTVESQIASYTLGANIERLVLSGGALNGTGNTLSNEIIGDNLANKLDGAGGNDNLIGEEGNDILLGQAGIDALEGGDGADTLKGGTGDDVLFGGFGDDTLLGEAGADLFVIGTNNPADLLLHGNDTIDGFQSGVDSIALGDLIAGFGIDAANAFTGTYVRLMQDGANTLVRFDQDGDGGGAPPVTVATVLNAVVVQSDIEFGSI